jgi:hypothetical protein
MDQVVDEFNALVRTGSIKILLSPPPDNAAGVLDTGPIDLNRLIRVVDDIEQLEIDFRRFDSSNTRTGGMYCVGNNGDEVELWMTSKSGEVIEAPLGTGESAGHCDQTSHRSIYHLFVYYVGGPELKSYP